VSHYTHTDPYPSETQHNITQYREKCLKRGDVGCANRMRSVRQMLRALPFVANIRPNLVLLFRTDFRSIRRSEIRMNIKVDLHTLNRRRRRFYLRRTCHVYQGL
jgi:hypothetical protein